MASSSDVASVMARRRGVFVAARERYTRVAIVLHWVIATFILINLCSGFFIQSWLHGTLKDSAPPQVRWLTLVLHVSSGLTVLALTVVRVVWRLLNSPPPYPAGFKPWERHAAHFAHFLLYSAMVLMPLTGWAILSAHPPAGSPGAAAVRLPPPSAAPAAAKAGPAPAAPRDVKIWNLMTVPVIAPIEAIGKEAGGVAPQHRLHEQFQEWHGAGGFLLLGVLLLHLLGALKHQFIDRHAEFARMGIGRRRRA